MVWVIRKIYCHQSEEELGRNIDHFWIKHEKLWSSIGSSQIWYIWTSSAIKDGKSYLCHNLYAKPLTKVLELVGCQLTLKLFTSNLLKGIVSTTSMSNVVRGHVCRVNHKRNRPYSMSQQRCTKIRWWEKYVSTTGLTWWLTCVFITLFIMIGRFSMPGYSIPGSRIGIETPW